jgi:hypothetical protein
MNGSAAKPWRPHSDWMTLGAFVPTPFTPQFTVCNADFDHAKQGPCAEGVKTPCAQWSSPIRLNLGQLIP